MQDPAGNAVHLLLAATASDLLVNDEQRHVPDRPVLCARWQTPPTVSDRLKCYWTRLRPLEVLHIHSFQHRYLANPGTYTLRGGLASVRESEN